MSFATKMFVLTVLGVGSTAISTAFIPAQIVLRAPDSTPYYEYSIGVANILKVLRVDFNFRGNYLDIPGARKFGITFTTGFFF